MPLQRLTNCGASLGIPDSNGAVIRSGDDVPSVRRVSNGLHVFGVPLQRLTNCSASLGIPDSNGAITRSRDDMPAIRGITDAIDSTSVTIPCQWRRWPRQQFPRLHLDAFSKPRVKEC